ncbi:phytoene/squalene synthase family protein [Chloroflexus sp.]|uniref:phytoene/squalene synthase family protein n=1 Tax=Chloroflexus sp. TaxID=1904827 RepID=UPI00298F2DFF|nr:phytoene/squalene synthase family protein [Chloroflexus sp.]MDW8402776.1 phytoene/squalene synthase family protein [Chloroflexus sp.]
MSLNSISIITRGNGLPVSQALPADEQLAQLFHLSDLPVSSNADELPPPSVRSLAEAYAICDQIIRRHSKSFFFSTQFLPPPQRRAVRALYAFCRTTDDTVDMATSDPARALAEWVRIARRPRLDTTHPVLMAWADTCQRYNLAPHLIDELLAGVAMDLTISRYATFADLWLYCYRVASVVGLLVIGITGAAPGATPYAIKLGVALQLTNILRDVGEDAGRQRVYLPEDELARFGLTADDILARVYDERFIALMKFQIERAHRLYDESWPGIALLPAEVRLAVAAAAQVYRGILDKIVANQYDSYTRRAYVPLREKVARLPRIWWDVRQLERKAR